jgi:hypothetical protein
VVLDPTVMTSFSAELEAVACDARDRLTGMLSALTEPGEDTDEARA